MMLALARRLDTVTVRVALAILCALLAVQGISTAFTLATSPREFPMIGARWLSSSVADVVASADEVDGASLPPLPSKVARLFTVQRMERRPQSAAGASDEIMATVGRMIEGALAERGLGPAGEGGVGIALILPSDRPIGSRGPPKPSIVDGTLIRGNADFLLPAVVRIEVRRQNGSWIVMSGRLAASDPWRYYVWIGSLLASAVLVGLCAWWTARRLIQPLRRLSHAADRLDGVNLGADVPESGPNELRRIARSFNAMQGRVLALVAERTRMAVAVSHDLRTPITRLRLRAEYVADADLQHSIIRDLAVMERIVDGTMQFARSEASFERPQWVELDAVLEDLCAALALNGAVIDYQQECAVVVRASLDGLERAFANLIGNAVKFASHVSIRLDADDRQAEIVIDDNGPGIDDSLKEKVFEPFFRADAARNFDTGGVGLGLTIARAVIVRCGGTIELRDRQPAGLSVRVTLPRVRESEQYIPPAASEPSLESR